MADLASTVVGGLIAAISGAATTIIAHWIGRRNKQTDSERQALIAWAAAFEEWVSTYHDYSGLVLARPADPAEAESWKELFLDRMKEAAEAGRRLDVAKNSVLIVAQRAWVREEVIRLTESSKVFSGSSTAEHKLHAMEFRERSAALRKDLSDFLGRLAKASAKQKGNCHEH